VRGCNNHSHEVRDITTCSERHEHKKIEEQFGTMHEALDYVKNMEYDAEFMNRRTYTTNLKFTKVYKCARDGFYNAKKTTKKLGMKCPAGFKIVGRKDTEEGAETFSIEGCITHNHSVDIAMRKVSRRSKDLITFLSNIGVPNNVIETKYFPASDYTTIRDKPVLLNDIRNVQKRTVPKPETIALPDAVATLITMQKPQIRKFNVRRIIPTQDEDIPASLESKVYSTEDDDTLVIYISEKQREAFRKNPYQLMVDGKLLIPMQSPKRVLEASSRSELREFLK
jgi:hypothetical protein